MSTVRKKRAPAEAPSTTQQQQQRRRRRPVPEVAEAPPDAIEALPATLPETAIAAADTPAAVTAPATESNDFDGAPPTALRGGGLPEPAPTKSTLAFRAADAEASDDTAAAATISEPLRRAIPTAEASAAPSIDELLTRAATRRTATMQSGVRLATSVADVLDTTPSTRIRSVDEFVEQVLNMVSVERVPQELLNDPVVVIGLSQDEPNPEWTALADQRAALEERAAFLLRERQAVQSMRRRADDDSALREALLRSKTTFEEPHDAIKLMKPVRVAQRVTEYWRALLGRVLKEQNGRFRSDTARLLIAAAVKAANVFDLLDNQKEPYEVRARVYVQHVVNPVLNDAVRQLQTATYEDLPLTRELVGELFDEFFDRLLDTLLRNRDADALAAMQQQQADEAAQVPLEGASVLAERADALVLAERADALVLAERADALLAEAIARMQSGFEQLQSVDDGEERELYERLSYLRQVVYVYADGTFYGFFENWSQSALRRIGDEARTRVLLASLERVLTNIIETRRRALARADDRAARAASNYAIPAENVMVDLYKEYIVRQIQAHRTQVLLQQDEDRDLLRALDSAFDAPKEQWAATNFLGIKLLVYPRVDRFELLERVYNSHKAQIGVRFAAADAAAAAAEAAELDKRNAELRKLLLEWSPITAPAVRARGAGDGDGDVDPIADPYWSIYNLAYPLSLESVGLQADELRGYVEYYAAIFDADAVHARSIALRSVLTVGYAEQLVQRELMRIDFALRELVRPVRAVPLELVLPVESAAAPLDLHVHIMLRPELAYVMQAPSAALRDPRVVELADNLGDADLEVFWWFQPTLDPRTGRATGGLERQLLARQSLPRNGNWAARTASFRVDGAGSGGAARAGLYWAEVRQTGYNISWRSKFTARLRVTARCVRDDVVYELGTEHFGACRWAEHARDRELTALVEEWRALVERGPEAQRRLLAQRTFDRLASERAGADEPASALLYLPPWGRDDDEASLLSALPRLQESDDEFAYQAILARAAHRIASQLRALPGTGAATNDAAARSDIDVLLLLADRDIDESAGEWFILQTLFAEHAAAGTFLEPAARHSDLQPPEPPLAYEGTLAERLRDARARRATLPALQRSGDSLPPLTSGLPRSAVAVPRFDERAPATAAARMPLATVLCLMTTPLIWPNLTWRERRFFEQLRARFDRLTMTLAQRWDAELRALAYTADQSWWRRHGSVDGAAALQNEVWHRLASITPDSLAFDGGAGESDMLVDRALRSEFDDLVQRRLVRAGLVTVHESRVRDPLTGLLRTRQWLAPTRDTESTLLAVHRPLGGARQMWLDAHTYETNQPSVYRIEIDNTARIHRGSEPCGKYYDFAGLHSIITMLAARYTELAPMVADDAVALAEWTRLRELLRDAEVLYNYLAFVAPAPPNRHMLTGAQLFALLTADDARNFFAQVRRQRARLGSLAAAGGALALQAVET
jgi:hypothetical protein